MRGSLNRSSTTEKQTCKNPSHKNTPLEAYCMGCKIPVCVHCIIEEHQSHEVKAIQDAAQIEKSIFQDYFKRAEELEEKLNAQIEGLDQHIDQVTKQAHRNLNKLSEIFNTI